MLQSHHQLMNLIHKRVLEHADIRNVNSASIDITLGQFILREVDPVLHGLDYQTVVLSERTPLNMEKLDITEGYTLAPGEFILAQSHEVFNLPAHISAEYKLKSSMARIGLDHLNAGWCDAGWNGSVLTLELVNVSRYHNITIKAGDSIGQMVFFEHAPVSDNHSYATRGRYNGDKEVTAIKE